MTIALRFAVLAASCLAAGCVPLQQAPLVYSSKLTVGLDVSANVAENQGASVNIGVKTIDSAYVPVAVSKEIDKKSAGGERTLELRLIEARYGYGEGSDSSDPAGAAERDKKIDAYFSARLVADAAAKEAAAKEAQANQFASRIAQIDALRSKIEAAQTALEPAQPQSAPRADPMVPLAKEVEVLARQGVIASALLPDQEGKYNVAPVAADLKAAGAALSRERDDILAKQLPPLKLRAQDTATAAAKAKEEALKVAGLSNTNKSDAMSVYGSFDSRSSADTGKSTSAGLLIGKVFSTGLASQNLTEAVKIGAGVQCFTSGFEAMQKMDKEEERKKILDTLAAMCAPQKTITGK